jgi:S1-C subfamily serine protease
MAAGEGQVETARKLLARDARANVWSDQLHITPLYLAVLAGHEPAAALLRERGADPAITDVFGQTPARAAAVMAGTKTRPLLSVTNRSLGFDPRAIVVLAYLGESQDRRTYRGNRVAVAFGDGSLLATAAHCVDDFAEARQKAILAQPLIFSPYHGDVFEAEILAVDASADLAILCVAWKEHPALPLADDQELQAAQEMLVAGYAPSEKKDGTRLVAPRQLSAEQLPVVQITVSNGAHRVILGGARFIGPGWSGSPTSGRSGCGGTLGATTAQLGPGSAVAGRQRLGHEKSRRRRSGRHSFSRGRETRARECSGSCLLRLAS